VSGPKAPRVLLSPSVRSELKRLTRTPTAEHREGLRARIVLLAAKGEGNEAIASQLGTTAKTVSKWRRRMIAAPKCASLADAPRSGRPLRIPSFARCVLIQLACSRPAGSKVPFRKTWSLHALQTTFEQQTRVHMSISEIRRTLDGAEIRPHRIRMWLHSPDPDFRRKVRRICDLYMHPPKGARVLCVDEKTGMQALDRIHPMRVPKRGSEGRFEFEYVRHGTRALIAAFDPHTGQVFARCGRQRRQKDLLAFMEALAARYPRGKVYIVWDNLNIHDSAHWRAFNRRHRNRFRFVYTPLHASWVNQIEIWFSILQRRVLKHGTFASGAELARAVAGFVRSWNLVEAHPFRWTFRGRTWNVDQSAAAAA
jgi:transposase